jgi:hypothetical protein
VTKGKSEAQQGKWTSQLEALKRIVTNEEYQYSDPVTDFVKAVYVDYDFERAQVCACASALCAVIIVTVVAQVADGNCAPAGELASSAMLLPLRPCTLAAVTSRVSPRGFCAPPSPPHCK